MLSILLLAAGTIAAPPARPDPIAGALDRAIARCQERVLENITVWEDHSNWENPWHVRTEHYEVHTSSRYHVGLGLGRGLDVMLGHFQRVLGTDFTPPQRAQVLIFPALGLYNNYGDAVAAEHSSAYGSFYAAGEPNQPVALLNDQNPTLRNMWATHSALHKFVDQAYGRQLDTWVSEGLASYFALYWAPEWGKSELRRLIDSGQYIPLERLVTDGLGAYVASPHAHFIELGMLFTYLLHYNEDTRMSLEGEERQESESSFRDFLQTVVGGGDWRNHPFAQIYMQLEEGFEQEFREMEWAG